jgi:hypothetical protein
MIATPTQPLATAEDRSSLDKIPAQDIVDDHEDDEDADEDDMPVSGAPGVEGSKKKKKKKKPKKKKVEQSDPPRIGLSKLFPSGVYPEGQIQEYQDEYVAKVVSHSVNQLTGASAVTDSGRLPRRSELSSEPSWRTLTKHITTSGERRRCIGRSVNVRVTSFGRVRPLNCTQDYMSDQEDARENYYGNRELHRRRHKSARRGVRHG